MSFLNSQQFCAQIPTGDGAGHNLRAGKPPKKPERGARAKQKTTRLAEETEIRHAVILEEQR